MYCPYCHAQDTKVVDTRQLDQRVKRRRSCMQCGAKFTTFERYEEPRVFVMKRDQTRQRYQRDKMSRGIRTACEKRNISEEAFEVLVHAIERELRVQTKDATAIKSQELGDIVLRHLSELDPVAYVRYASVYKDFKDLHQFAEELSSLQRKNKRV